MRALPPPAVVGLGLLLPAGIVLALAFDDGGYSVESRGSWAIATWWLLALGAVLGWWPSRERSPARTAVVALLTGFALLTLVSALWSTNDADAFSEFNRVSFYLGVFLLVLQVAPRGLPHRLGDGLALGITAVVAVALLSRCAPGLLSPDRVLEEAVPSAAARLSYPIGYWNGLAILAALAVPLLLRASASPGHVVRRALAAAPLPAIAATIYLASSRGGIATAATGAVAYVALSRFRWSAVGALLAAGAGSALALAALVSQSEFVDEPAAASTSTRVSVAVMVILGCLAAFALRSAFATVLARVSAPPRWVAIAATTAAVAVGVAIIVAADPAERLRTFAQPPAEAAPGDDVLGHLVSVGGSGRWQFWETALDAWQESPLLGQGAGSYEAWWAQHGSLSIFVRDAHSLYAETLAELGSPGLALLAAVAAAALLASWRQIRGLPALRADAVAAASAVILAYAVAAGIDWVWELPVVTLVAFACLAVPLISTGSEPGPTRKRAQTAFAGIAIVAVVAQAIPYLSQVRIRESQSKAASGNFAGALASARSAREIQPWGPDPWLQLALVYEQRGELEPARTAIVRATREDREDWRLWLVAVRIDTKLGQITEARKSLERAIQLNPRSPLFEGLR